MKVKKAVIACQVFYHEIFAGTRDKGIKVELLPQGLHDRVDSRYMRYKIQKKLTYLRQEMTTIL